MRQKVSRHGLLGSDSGAVENSLRRAEGLFFDLDRNRPTTSLVSPQPGVKQTAKLQTVSSHSGTMKHQRIPIRDPVQPLQFYCRKFQFAGASCSVSRTRVKARDAVPKMGVGLPESACRSWLQTARCCCVRKRRGGERPWKRHPERCQVRIEEMNESKPSDDASLALKCCQNWSRARTPGLAGKEPVYGPGGSRCIGGMNSIQAWVMGAV
jgi:hypothetical protein